MTPALTPQGTYTGATIGAGVLNTAADVRAFNRRRPMPIGDQ